MTAKETKNIELILFDLDGTLIDARKDIANAVNFMLRKFGLPEKSPDEISSYIGRGVKDLVLRSLGKEAVSFSEKAVPVFENYYRKHICENSFLYPGVVSTLEYFKSKRKAVITNRNRESAVLILKDLGAYDHFEYIAAGDDIGCAKPSSCPVDKALGDLKVSKSKTIMVGDMDIDVIAGRSSGVLTCAVTYGIGKREDILKAKPDFIINDITELKNIIE